MFTESEDESKTTHRRKKVSLNFLDDDCSGDELDNSQDTMFNSQSMFEESSPSHASSEEFELSPGRLSSQSEEFEDSQLKSDTEEFELSPGRQNSLKLSSQSEEFEDSQRESDAGDRLSNSPVKALSDGSISDLETSLASPSSSEKRKHSFNAMERGKRRKMDKHPKVSPKEKKATIPLVVDPTIESVKNLQFSLGILPKHEKSELSFSVQSSPPKLQKSELSVSVESSPLSTSGIDMSTDSDCEVMDMRPSRDLTVVASSTISTVIGGALRQLADKGSNPTPPPTSLYSLVDLTKPLPSKLHDIVDLTSSVIAPPTRRTDFQPKTFSDCDIVSVKEGSDDVIVVVPDYVPKTRNIPASNPPISAVTTVSLPSEAAQPLALNTNTPTNPLTAPSPAPSTNLSTVSTCSITSNTGVIRSMGLTVSNVVTAAYNAIQQLSGSRTGTSATVSTHQPISERRGRTGRLEYRCDCMRCKGLTWFLQSSTVRSHRNRFGTFDGHLPDVEAPRPAGPYRPTAPPRPTITSHPAAPPCATAPPRPTVPPHLAAPPRATAPPRPTAPSHPTVPPRPTAHHHHHHIAPSHPRAPPRAPAPHTDSNRRTMTASVTSFGGICPRGQLSGRWGFPTPRTPPPARPAPSVPSVPATDTADSTQSPFTCPVCFDSKSQILSTNRNFVSTHCGHIFCNRCIEEVARINRKCPTCRKLLRGRAAWHNIYI